MDDYKLKGKLGEGGMGQVYRAVQVSLNRPVAIKMLGHDQAGMPDMAHRFVREAQLLCTISHPNIVPVFDTGALGDRPFFVMALVEGPSLAEAVDATGPIDLLRVVPILHQLSDALAYLHERGIHHRDIKPRNMILGRKDDQDMVMLVDFGLAKSATSRPLTEAGEIIGSMHYMAPEVFTAGVQEGPQDVWALAVSGHFMLTGQRAFPGATFQEVTQQVTSCDPGALVQLFPTSVPVWLKGLIRDCLSKDPAMRPAMATIRDTLASGASGLGIPAYQRFDPLPPDPEPGARRRGPGPGGRSREVAVPGGIVAKSLVTGAAATGVLAVALALWSLAHPEGSVTKVTTSPVTPGPSPADPVARAAPSGPFPLENFVCFPSHDRVLVDFDTRRPVDLVISLTATGGDPIHRVHNHSGSQGWFRRVLEPLPPDRDFLLRIETADGVPVIPGFPVRTSGRELAAEVRSELDGLRGSDLTLPLALDEMRLFDDPGSLAAMAALVKGFGPARFSKRNLDQIAQLAAKMKDPTLATLLLESREEKISPAGALRAGDAARLPLAAEKARVWIEGAAKALDPGLFEACARALARERREDAASRIVELVERTGLWTTGTLEALIDCDAATARSAFGRWASRGKEAIFFRLAAAAGWSLLGGVPDLAYLDEMMREVDQALLRSSMAPLLVDAHGPGAAATLARVTAWGFREPSLVWSAARAGVALPEPPSPLPGAADGPLLALLLGPGLQDPRPADLVSRRRMLGSRVAWHRDVAAGLLAGWKDAESVEALTKLAESEEDTEGVGAFALARIAGARAPASIVDTFLAMSADPAKVSTARMTRMMWAAHAVDPRRARPAIQAIAARDGLPWAVLELARHLAVEMPAEGVQSIWILPHGTYARTGIRMTAGQGIRARAWGFHESAEKPGTWQRFLDRLHWREKGPSLAPNLHHRGQQWLLRREWRTFLATADGELLFTPCLRSPAGTEWPVDRFLPGLVRLDFERGIERVETPAAGG